jgi:hypothetical protein
MRSQQGFQVLIQMVVFPLTFLAGVFFPVNNVPRWMEIVSKLNPLTYGVDAIRRIFLADEISAGALASSHPIIGGDRLRAHDHDARGCRAGRRPRRRLADGRHFLLQPPGVSRRPAAAARAARLTPAGPPLRIGAPMHSARAPFHE